MERVYKGIMGGYKAENDKNDATHVILTVNEYNDLKKRIGSLEFEIQDNISAYKKDIEEERQLANKNIDIIKGQAQKAINTLQIDLKGAKGEIDRLNDLNLNLRRIMRERANSKRGLKPKKVHHGYMVLDSQQYSYIFRYWSHGKSRSDDFPCWKVRIQSPYDSSIPYETIVNDIRNDLIKVFGASLNIQSVINLDNKSYDDFKKAWNEEKNFIFKSSYKSNIKSGFWEIEYLVKDSIVVPEDMRIS